jgi:hypothetical protein
LKRLIGNNVIAVISVIKYSKFNGKNGIKRMEILGINYSKKRKEGKVLLLG